MHPVTLPASSQQQCAGHRAQLRQQQQVQQQRVVSSLALASSAGLQALRRRRPHSSHITSAAAAGDAGGAAAPSQPAGSRQPGPLAAVLGWLPNRQALALLGGAWSLLYNNLWAAVALFLAKDAAAFVLYRLMHRLTNHVAELALGLPISSMANPWWLVTDAQFMQGHVGYQVLVGAAFVLSLPFNILLNTAAVATAISVAVARQAALEGPGVATASFTGQGRGKVGLADYPRPPSVHSSMDEGDASSGSSSSSSVTSSVESAAVAAAIVAAAARSAGSVGAGAVGDANLRAPAAVTFRGSSSRTRRRSGSRGSSRASSSSSAAAGGVQQQQRQQQQQQAGQPPPPAAPAVPWLTVVQERSKPPPLLGLRPSIAAAREAWGAQVAPRLGQLWRVDLLFNVWALPLQAACLAVLPALWAFPRLLIIQLALPAALLDGSVASPKAALEASRRLMAGFETAYAWPFVWLIVGGRVLELARDVVLLAMPNRWWVDVPEVPLVATAAFFAMRVVLLRLQDLMPLAAYLLLSKQQAAGGVGVGVGVGGGPGQAAVRTTPLRA